MSELPALVDRCLLVGFEEREPPAWLLRAAPDLGGVVLYGQNLAVDGDVPRLAAALHAHSDVVVAIDEEGGDVTRLHYRSGSTSPGNHVLGAAGDTRLTAAVAAGLGRALRAAGVGLNLAPDVDVNSAPDNPVIGVRAFGADPDLVGRHATAWIDALQATGVAACAKHFPGHGDTRADSHLGLPTVYSDEATWRAQHLPPFTASIAAGVRAVMTAHVRVPALDAGWSPAWAGAPPATTSHRLLTGVLRDELGFDGVIVTDALDMGAIRDGIGEPAGAVAALTAGADALCLGAVGGEGLYRRVREAILAAVAGGELPGDRVEQAAARVGELRAWLASRDQPAGDGAGPDPGLAAARRAVLARGIRPLTAPAVVVELRAEANLAVGDAPWSLAAPLRALGRPPAQVTAVLPDEEDPRAVLAAAAGRPLVVVGRDVVRQPWQRRWWAAVRSAHPDPVLVDIGLPRPDVLDGLADHYVLTGGAGRPNLRVAAELLAGEEPGKTRERAVTEP